jgi:hypothetical protein
MNRELDMDDCPIGLNLDEEYSMDACDQLDVTALISEGRNVPASQHTLAFLFKMHFAGETSPHSVLLMEMSSTFSEDYIAESISQSIEQDIEQSISDGFY